MSAESAADPEDGLRKMGLLRDDETGVTRATVAGILLCAPAPEAWLPNACITATHYRDRDRSTGQIDTQTIGGPLRRQIADAVAFAIRNMRVGAHKDTARMDLPQYSARALFEAVTNAVVHRDYSIRGSRIRLSMFEDRLEIQSPGALPNNLTIDELPDRQSTRNELLASLLGRMPVTGIKGADDRLFVMERRGDGIRIIQRETRALGGETAAFRLIGDSELCVILPAANTEPDPARVAVSVRHAGAPLGGVAVLVLFPNNTSTQATTDQHGNTTVALYTADLPMTVFLAASGLAAHLERDWVPARGPLTVDMRSLSGGGSVILSDTRGRIPGLMGRFTPRRDVHDRTYAYATDIAIDKGRAQPVHFVLGEELRLTDAAGHETMVRVVDIRGGSALVEYRTLTP